MKPEVGQLCFLKETGESYYFLGEKILKRSGKIVNVFKKYTKKSGFTCGFGIFDKLSEFDETLTILGKQTKEHFVQEMNKCLLFK